jgi:hypothetical protein
LGWGKKITTPARIAIEDNKGSRAVVILNLEN